MVIEPQAPLQEPAPISASNLFASRHVIGESIIIGGLVHDEQEWVQTLTQRAARSLWFDLTRLLFPEKSDEVIAQVATMPSLPPFNSETSYLTTWTFVSIRPGGGCEIAGWTGRPGWRIHLSARDVYRFWAALDAALFPVV